MRTANHRCNGMCVHALCAHACIHELLLLLLLLLGIAPIFLLSLFTLYWLLSCTSHLMSSAVARCHTHLHTCDTPP